MSFSEIVKETKRLLRESGRVTYRVLQREFDLDEEAGRVGLLMLTQREPLLDMYLTASNEG